MAGNDKVCGIGTGAGANADAGGGGVDRGVTGGSGWIAFVAVEGYGVAVGGFGISGGACGLATSDLSNGVLKLGSSGSAVGGEGARLRVVVAGADKDVCCSGGVDISGRLGAFACSRGEIVPVAAGRSSADVIKVPGFVASGSW